MALTNAELAAAIEAGPEKYIIARSTIKDTTGKVMFTTNVEAFDPGDLGVIAIASQPVSQTETPSPFITLPDPAGNPIHFNASHVTDIQSAGQGVTRVTTNAGSSFSLAKDIKEVIKAVEDVLAVLAKFGL